MLPMGIFISPAPAKRAGLSLRRQSLVGRKTASQTTKTFADRYARLSDAATRPLDTRLDCGAIAQKFCISPQPWDHALEDTIDCLLTNKDVP